ncbi:MAG: hypothetical protein ACLGIV_05330 [Actinomycetes bacterium]
MIVLALLLLVVVAAIVLFVVVSGSTETVRLEWDDMNLAWAPSALVVFLLGAVTLLLAVLALGMIRGGTRRKVEQRRELRRLREVEKERAAAESERREAQRREAERHEAERLEGERHDTSAPVAPTDPATQTHTYPAAPTHPDDPPAHHHAGDQSESSWYDTPPERR